MKYTFLSILTFIVCLTVTAQDTLHVKVIANVKKDVIQLRWAVNSPLAWKHTNKYGFRLERYTVVRNNELLATPEKAILGEVIKPQPIENWEALATKNSYAAIIAQAIYGERFELSGDDAKGVSKFIALAQELDQRYMVSMYAADLCYPATLLAGWGFEDKTVKPGERYLYRVIPLVPVNTMKIELGSVYTSLQEMQPLPQPQELTALFGDKTVMLTWNYGILKNTYNAYHVERSSDGKNFTRLSDIPLMNMNGQEGKPADRMYHIDSLANNTMKTCYRIIGVTAFSEEGPPSEMVTGEGKDKLIYVPHISRAVPDGKGAVDIEWEFDERGNKTIKGFELQRADNHNGPFVSIVSGIEAIKRNISYNKLEASNYFVVAAIPHEGDPVVSFPVLVQPIDSIPPAIPVGLEGTVDSLGIVRLSWQSNQDLDLLGYRIYRGQTKGEELVPLNDVAIRENNFIDTIEVRNLNSKIFYAITAVDMRYNQSLKSAVAELLKPDVVPPSAPVITNYKVTSEGIMLEWVTGEEESMGSINLYRVDKSTNENKLIKTFNDVTVTQYIDKDTESNKAYGYTLTSLTKREKPSDPSRSVTIRAPFKVGMKGNIIDFTAKVNQKKRQIDLQWNHNLNDIKEFELYRGEIGKQISLWKILKAYEVKAEDKEVHVEAEYEYLIRAIKNDGKTAAVSKVTTKKVRQ